MFFLESALTIFQKPLEILQVKILKNIKLIEILVIYFFQTSNILITEVINVMNDFRQKIFDRKTDMFFGTKTIGQLNLLRENGFDEKADSLAEDYLVIILF